MKTLQTLFFFLLVTQICFAQWYQQNSGTTQNLYAVHFIDATTGWVVGGNGTIVKTQNGGTDWILQTSGTAIGLADVYFVDDSTGWVIGNGVWPPEYIALKTTDGGMNWFQLMYDTTLWLSDIFFIDHNIGWIVGDLGTILKTTDGGTNWITQTTPTTLGLHDIYFTDANIGFVAGGYHEFSAVGCILYTTNGGDIWVEQTIDSMICWDGISFFDSQNGIVVGSAWSAIGSSGQIYRTTNGGLNWLPAWGAPFGYFVNSTIADFNYAWAIEHPCISGGDGIILLSDDNGVSWSEAALFPFSSLPNSMYFIDSLKGWAVGDSGTIRYTTNSGVHVELAVFTATSSGEEVILNWTTATELNNQGFEIQRSTEGKEFFTIGFVNGHGTTTEQQNYSYADRNLDNGKYYYRLKQFDFDGSYEYSDVVEIDYRTFNSYVLDQNYPNPFNPTTTIGFGLQNKSNVKIKILNAIGEEVAVVLNEERGQGFHQVEFNAANLPSGVYFYQFRAGDFVSVKKMILIK